MRDSRAGTPVYVARGGGPVAAGGVVVPGAGADAVVTAGGADVTAVEVGTEVAGTDTEDEMDEDSGTDEDEPVVACLFFNMPGLCAKASPAYRAESCKAVATRKTESFMTVGIKERQRTGGGYEEEQTTKRNYNNGKSNKYKGNFCPCRHIMPRLFPSLPTDPPHLCPGITQS